MAKSPLDQIRDMASRYPEAEHTTILGDHEVFRVREKVFLWLGDSHEVKDAIYVNVKLKDTQEAALMLPFVKPVGYGMAKWGWVAGTFPKGKFPASLVEQWIAESYRHTAPKKLLKQLEAGGDVPRGVRAPKPTRATPKPTAKARRAK